MVVLKKIIHYLSFIIYFLISMYAITCIPIIGNIHPVVVLTGSMEPTYKVGSIIYYKAVDYDSLKKGDIITFIDKKQNTVSHRIVRIEKDEIEVKGDANNTSDLDRVNKKNVLGKTLSFSIPIIGYYIHFVEKKWIICIGFIILLLGLEFILSNLEIDYNSGGMNENKI